MIVNINIDGNEIALDDRLTMPFLFQDFYVYQHDRFFA